MRTKEYRRGYIDGVLVMAVVLILMHAYEVVGCPGLSTSWARLALECHP